MGNLGSLGDKGQIETRSLDRIPRVQVSLNLLSARENALFEKSTFAKTRDPLPTRHNVQPGTSNG